MCLTINKSHKFLGWYKAKRVKKPITVYKILEFIDYTSPFRSYQYHKGLNYPDTVGPIYLRDNYIRSGYLHAYQRLSLAELKACRFSCIEGSKIARVIEMIIPKGSFYFLGTNGDICATCLKW